MQSIKYQKLHLSKNRTLSVDHSASAYLFTTLILNFILLLAFSSPAWSFKFTATNHEFISSTSICKKALVSGGNIRVDDKSLAKPYVSQGRTELGNVIWSVGGWHYCGGDIYLKRAKNSLDKKSKEWLLKRAISETNYSYSRINKNNPWAIDMAGTLAEALYESNEKTQAFNILEEIGNYHPKSTKAMALKALFYYREKDYQKAYNTYLQAHKEDPDSLQIAYLTGLAAFKMGDIQKAQQFASIAKDHGYPLTGLQRMIDKQIGQKK